MPFRFSRFCSVVCSGVAALGCAVALPGVLRTQDTGAAEARARLVLSAPNPHGTSSQANLPALLWLRPVNGRSLPFPPAGPYTLTQKHRTFLPHLLVVPVGSVVRFPNADPFFHDVFSLFDGKRFDLGLYEAGTTKEVRFSREGFSYIFCNIHPEMSAVVVALSTPLYALADEHGEFLLRGVPPGDYDLHVWLEGAEPAALNQLTRRVHLEPGRTDLGLLPLPYTAHPSHHENKFGQPYTPGAKDGYGPGAQ